jgi:hypothetical protein
MLVMSIYLKPSLFGSSAMYAAALYGLVLAVLSAFSLRGAARLAWWPLGSTGCCSLPPATSRKEAMNGPENRSNAVGQKPRP